MSTIFQNRTTHAKQPSRNARSATRRLLILGTRSGCEDVADWAADLPDVEVIGFVENRTPRIPGGRLNGFPVFWIDDVPRPRDAYCCVCGLSTTRRDPFLRDAVQRGLDFTSLQHPTAHVSGSAHLATGTLVAPLAVLAAQARLEPHVAVGRGALIGHHTTIGTCATIGPGAKIAGKCCIGRAVYIGIGAVIRDGVTIGDHAVVGAGAVVTKDVPERVQVVGVPARIVKRGIDGM